MDLPRAGAPATQVAVTTIVRGIATATRIATRIGIATKTKIGTDIATETKIGIEIEIETVIEIGTVTGIVTAASMTRPRYTIPRITAPTGTARTPTNRATRMGCIQAQTMAGAGKAMIRSAHTSTGVGIPGSFLFSALAIRTNRLTGTVFSGAIRKATRTGNGISPGEAFIVSQSARATGSKLFGPGALRRVTCCRSYVPDRIGSRDFRWPELPFQEKRLPRLRFQRPSSWPDADRSVRYIERFRMSPTRYRAGS